MARLVPAKCPTCGAGLTVPPKVEWVTCGYCHTSCFVHRDEAQAPPPVPLGTAVIRVVPPARPSAAPWVFFGLMVLSAAGIGAFNAWTQRNGRNEASTHWTLATLRLGAPARGPLLGRQFLTDVNGDGTDDVIIHALHVPHSDQHLLAIDGATGATLWTSEELLKGTESEVVAAVPGAVLTVVDGVAVALDARTGEPRFRSSLPEKAEAVCSTDSGVRILGRDGQFYVLDDRTGAVQAAGAAPSVGDGLQPKCTPVASDLWSANGGALRQGGADADGPKVIEIGHVLAAEYQPIRLIVGTRVNGTPVPMVGGLRGKRVVWYSEVPASDPLSVKEGEPAAATMAAGRAIVVYFCTSGEAHVTAFTLSNGERLWDSALPPAHPSTSYVSANARYAYVYTADGPEQALHRVNLADGHVDWGI